MGLAGPHRQCSALVRARAGAPQSAAAAPGPVQNAQIALPAPRPTAQASLRASQAPPPRRRQRAEGGDSVDRRRAVGEPGGGGHHPHAKESLALPASLQWRPLTDREPHATVRGLDELCSVKSDLKTATLTGRR